MGQKIHPTGFRLAVNKDWSSKWFAKSSDFSVVLKQDIDVREYLRKRLSNASIGRVVIERPAKSARVTIFSARPGMVIGRKGEDIDVLKRDLQNLMGVPVHVNIEEIRKPELDAQIYCRWNSSTIGKACSISSRYEACHAKCYACWCKRYQNYDLWTVKWC